MRPTSRPFASLDDLREMQSIVTDAWSSDRRPLVSCTIGDLAWWFAGAGPGIDWSSRIRIIERGGQSVGWGWLKPPSSIDHFVRAGLGEAEERAVLTEILAWAAERLGEAPREADEPPPALEAWAADGWLEADVLAGLGFAPSEETLTQYFRSLETPLPEVSPPAGYAIRSVAGAGEIPGRVDVHRAAFAPSKMTVEKYEILVGLEPYAFERDVVAVAPDGSFAAFTMCWLDGEARIGEFEPVGTHPEHRRQGLGKAVNTHGLRVLREAGARGAMVFSETSNGASEALYQSVGFRQIALHRRYAARPTP